MWCVASVVRISKTLHGVGGRAHPPLCSGVFALAGQARTAGRGELAGRRGHLSTLCTRFPEVSPKL